MSRLTELIRKTKEKDPELGLELEREFRALSGRRAFGLNFERHRPEAVELPQRPVRRGDKVRVLPTRGSAGKGDQRLWRVTRVEKVDGQRLGHLELLDSDLGESVAAPTEDLVVVAEFRDPIYPGLVPTGRVERGGDKPAHTVITGENFHVLKALTYTHKGKVDVIYIDPPYNTGAKDWKYNNDYVEGDDLYRHSKWLAFMERRLLLARELLNPEKSVLIVTIDEKEVHRLALLLSQTFPGVRTQMVSSVINPAGTGRKNEFSRTNEYIFVLQVGDVVIQPMAPETDESVPVEWEPFRRRDLASRRGTSKGGRSQFYPVYVDRESKRIVGTGEPLPPGTDRLTAPARPGCASVFPVREDGTEMNWALTREEFERRLDKGYVRLGRHQPSGPQEFVVSYLRTGPISDIEEGRAIVTGKNSDGSVIARYPEGKRRMPLTQWDRPSHDAQRYGTTLLNTLTPGRRFPFPKSLYAVEDTVRIAVGALPDAVVLDFFAGSGTTAHAVMRLNRQDGGRRQCISVSNNEVSADEQRKLRSDGLRPGDPEWEQLGICDHITKPRIAAAITGVTPSGEPINGDYRFTDEFPMADGFDENAEFFTLTYETPIVIGHNRAFERIAPLLWLRAGARGRCIDKVSEAGWDVAITYGILFDLDQASAFCLATERSEDLRLAYIVTDDDRRFQAVSRQLPDAVEPVRLYESYLSNFRFTGGEQ